MKKYTDVYIDKVVKRKNHVLDADGKILGRLAQEVAVLLRGKGKPTFSYERDHGDYVVVVNAEKIKVTGRKLKDKSYTRYSGYPGGLKRRSLEEFLEIQPEKVIQHAVQGMLPKNPLGRKMFKKLRVYRGNILKKVS